ncbi:hypothetical protein [Halorussus marinus]|uniref:hypothetical protein n=1 Tax=Halorussus marinus TaxID=2505976 RepID=UPI00109295F6|nr:hypothetical protein [Halorussus marinus]
MLRAERGDALDVDGVGVLEIVKRTNTYYGPKLTLFDEGDDNRNYRLVAPGFASELELWRSIRNEDGFIEAWERLGEVSAELVDTKQYDICPECGEPLKTIEHEREALAGVCGL